MNRIRKEWAFYKRILKNNETKFNVDVYRAIYSGYFTTIGSAENFEGLV